MDSTKLKHEETDSDVSRYTLAYPELPTDVANAISGDTSELPDYSNASLEELDDNYDPTQSNAKSESNSKYHVSGYANQGGYDAELDWNADNTRLWHDSFFTQNALLRRAMIGGLKGMVVGIGFGIGCSLLGKRYMTFTHKLPISFHVYTIGGGATMFGGMNAVHQAKRYKEYIGFKQTGISNPEMIGLKDAKNQMADWMASAYSPEYVEQWKQAEETEVALQNQMAGIRT
mmetsp:Transcript_5901/g.5151  ORF Transcript_5901/g.5151 Transcript_5901/m.5151 type:complete len:231 (-) Transcript_5901:159-851(-)